MRMKQSRTRKRRRKSGGEEEEGEEKISSPLKTVLRESQITQNPIGHYKTGLYSR